MHHILRAGRRPSGGGRERPAYTLGHAQQRSLLEPKTLAVAFDLTNDGALTSADVAVLLSNLSSGSPQADFDLSGVIDLADFRLLLSASEHANSR